MLTGKVAVVTGGSRGIGRAIAKALLDRGADVAIIATSEGPLQRTAAELSDSSGHGAVLPIRADVTRHADVDQAIHTAAQHFGGLDVLVNNAGVGRFRAVADMSIDEWRTVIDTNLSGVFYACRAVLPHLRARGGGWIINISSLAAQNAFPNAAAYCASKAGLNAFSEALMQEVRYDGIRVAYVMPGSVATDFRGSTPADQDWKLTAEDVDQVVVDLLAHPSRSLPSRVEIRPSRPPQKR